MRSISRKTRVAGLLAVSLIMASLSLPAAADWLVTRDGIRIETRGPWRVEGRLVVFEQKDGKLGSLRASDVDLDASRRLTEEEVAHRDESSEPPPPKPRAKIRLTQADLPPAPPLPAAPVEGDGDGADGKSSATDEQGPGLLEVASFQEIGANGPGIAFTGTVRNSSEATAVGVGVTVVLFDERPVEIARTAALLASTAIPSGESAAFRSEFPEVFAYTRARFDVSGDLLRTSPPEGSDQDFDDETEPDS